MRSFIAALSLGCLLALAAGCGEEESGAGAWAGDVCSSVEEWRENLTSLAVDAQVEGLSPETVITAIEGGVEATERLRDQLNDLGPPDTQAGDEIEQQLDELADSVVETADEARERAEDLPENQSVPELIQSLMSIAQDLQAVVGEAEATFTELQQLEPGRELEEAFENSEDCQNLRQDGGG
jgi:flagellar motor switch/type III secretory pathway protein FliN